MKRTIKLWEIALLIGCLLTLLFGNLFQAEKTVSDLQQHVLRMHILANSDSDADQQLKYQVRDALLASSETLFGSSQSESREALETTAKAHLHCTTGRAGAGIFLSSQSRVGDDALYRTYL